MNAPHTLSGLSVTTTTIGLNVGRYDRQIAIVAALTRAFDKFKHHEKFTQRVKPIIQAEVGDGYTVSVAVEEFLSSISVWGNGLGYNERVYVSWSRKKTWQEGLQEALQIADSRDYEERLQQEQTIVDALDAMEAQVEEIRQRAAQMIGALPIPTTATIRKDSVFWQGPTSELRERCPLLFGRMDK